MTPTRALIEAAENAAIWLANCTPIGKPTDKYPLPLLLSAISSAKAAEEGGWIDVKQELPPFGERVLAYSPANKHQGSRYFVTSLHVYSGKKDMIWLDEDINQWATHWRPVPEPPTVISVREKEGL